MSVEPPVVGQRHRQPLVRPQAPDRGDPGEVAQLQRQRGVEVEVARRQLEDLAGHGEARDRDRQHPAEPRAAASVPRCRRPSSTMPTAPASEQHEQQVVLAAEGLEPLGQRAASQDSSTTNATAIPASCDSDRCTRSTPSSPARAATVPRSSKDGPAAHVDDHLGVVPGQVAGRAERLGQRLLGGEPGRERLQRQRGLGRGEQPLAQASACARATARSARSSTTSVPTPMITRLLDRDGLRQVARLVDVVAHRGGQLAGEQLERARWRRSAAAGWVRRAA